MLVLKLCALKCKFQLQTRYTSFQALSYTQTLLCDLFVRAQGLPIDHGVISPVEAEEWLRDSTRSFGLLLHDRSANLAERFSDLLLEGCLFDAAFRSSFQPDLNF